MIARSVTTPLLALLRLRLRLFPGLTMGLGLVAALLCIASAHAGPPDTGKKVELLAQTWEGEPAGMFGELQAEKTAAVPLPKDCRQLNVFYEISGKDPEQEAQCRLNVAYGSGGDSQAQIVKIKGTETKKGRIPSVLTEPHRRVIAQCITSDRFRAMKLHIRLTCEGGIEKNEKFLEDLDKFLKTE